MIRGKNVILRTVRPQELDHLYNLIFNINEKGPYWHLHIQPLNDFKKSTSVPDSGLSKKAE